MAWTSSDIGACACVALFWILLNVADVFCIYFYIQSDVYTYLRTALNRSYGGFKAFAWFTFTFGAIMMFINFWICFGFARPTCAWLSDLPTRIPTWLRRRRRHTSPHIADSLSLEREKGFWGRLVKASRTRISSVIHLNGLGHGTQSELASPLETQPRPQGGIIGRVLKVPWTLLVYIVVWSFACGAALSPFVSPFVAIPVLKQHIWNHQCDAYPVEVILDGRSYNKVSSNDPPPVASFYFWQNGTRMKLYDYNVPYGGLDSAFRVQLGNVAQNVPQDLYPLVREVSYVNSGLQGRCFTSPGASANDTEPCLQGSFHFDFLSLSINDTRTSTVTNFRTPYKDWTVFGGVPGFVLKQVDGNNATGDTVIQTATTKRGDCTVLKACLQQGSQLDMIVPIGLALQQQDDYSIWCTQN